MNPFYFRELPLQAPFCNRTREISELTSHAQNRANVVLYSPRRYGKTSLVKRIQHNLSATCAIYVDFFGVDSIEDVAARIAAKTYGYCHKDKSLMQKAIEYLSSWHPVVKPDPMTTLSVTVEPVAHKPGMTVLNETLEGLGRFISSAPDLVHIVFDEFQEIVELKESLSIEATMRSHIQTHSNASYFFVGSRRRLLVDIFNDRKRPFYRSAVNYPLDPLPLNEAAEFIRGRFRPKDCPLEAAEYIVNLVGGYPYYVQRIPYALYEIAEESVTPDMIPIAVQRVLEEERLVFESMVRVLAPGQIKLLHAINEEATAKPFAAAYMSRFNLGAAGTVQGALKKLIELDYIEYKSDVYQLVDNVFGLWLKRLRSRS